MEGASAPEAMDRVDIPGQAEIPVHRFWEKC